MTQPDERRGVTITCRVCGRAIEDGQFAFDPAADYSRWPDVRPPCVIHKDCVPRACKEMAERYARDLARATREGDDADERGKA